MLLGPGRGRRIRRPTSPVLPGNYLVNPVKLSYEEEHGKGKGKGKNNKTTKKEEVRSEYQLEEDIFEEIKANIYKEQPKGELFNRDYHGCGQSEAELMDIAGRPMHNRFLVINFGVYTTSKYVVMPAEFTIADFNIATGIGNCFTQILDPGAIPVGYRSEVMETAKANGYMTPGFDPEMDFYEKCLRHIQVRMNMLHTSDDDGDEVAFIYCMPKDMDKIKECLTWIANKAGAGEFTCKLMPFPVLIQVLVTQAIALRGADNNELPTMLDLEILKALNSNEYLLEASLACKYHNSENRVDLVEHCTSTQVKSLIYYALRIMMRYFDVHPFLITHVPWIEPGDSVVEYRPPKPDISHLNDEDSDAMSIESDKTDELLFYAGGASSGHRSTPPSSVWSGSDSSDESIKSGSSGSDSGEGDYDVPSDPAVTFTTIENLMIGLKLNLTRNQSQFKAPPKNENVEFTPAPLSIAAGKPGKHGNILEVGILSRCKFCFQDECDCLNSIPLQGRRILKVEKENPDDPTKSDVSSEISDASSEKSDASSEKSDAPSEESIAPSEESDAPSDESDATLEESDAAFEDSDASLNDSPSNSSSRSSVTSISPESLKSDKTVDEKMKVPALWYEMSRMYGWQKVLPSTGGRGRGFQRWAGSGNKMKHDPFNEKTPGITSDIDSGFSTGLNKLGSGHAPLNYEGDPSDEPWRPETYPQVKKSSDRGSAPSLISAPSSSGSAAGSDSSDEVKKNPKLENLDDEVDKSGMTSPPLSDVSLPESVTSAWSWNSRGTQKK